jgi:hypothetical protein
LEPERLPLLPRLPLDDRDEDLARERLPEDRFTELDLDRVEPERGLTDDFREPLRELDRLFTRGRVVVLRLTALPRFEVGRERGVYVGRVPRVVPGRVKVRVDDLPRMTRVGTSRPVRERPPRVTMRVLPIARRVVTG